VGFCLIIDKQFKDVILSICKEHDIDSWEIGKIVRKNDSTVSKFLPEILT
jgi:phosphoribosylformylglycinamidine cyclo-ligase